MLNVNLNNSSKNGFCTSAKLVFYQNYGLLASHTSIIIQLVLILSYNLFDAERNGQNLITINLNETLVPLPQNITKMSKEEKIYYLREIEVKYKLAREVRYIKETYCRRSHNVQNKQLFSLWCV